MSSNNTLILTPWMQPHRIVHWETAICLLVTGKIDVVESYDEVISSPSVSFSLPAVARLRRSVGNWKRGVRFSRINVYTRDNFTCCYCNKTLHPRDLTYDHVIPRSLGGRTDWHNIVSACRKCNDRKGNTPLEKSGMTLLRKPHKPSSLPFANPFYKIQDIPELWIPYIGEEGRALSLAV